MNTEMRTSSGRGLGAFFLGMVIGLVAGGASALLLAPQSGGETRSMIKDRFNRMRDAVRERAQEAAENVEQMKEEA